MDNAKGWALLDGTPWRKWVSSANLPCCTLVATWEMEVAGQGIENPTAWEPYYRKNREWWGRANVVDGAKPWSSVAAANQMLGGKRAYVACVGPDPAPALTPDHWHVVQRWKGLDEGVKDGWSDDLYQDGATGHTYLAYMDAFKVVTIIQSSVKLGFRIDEGSWEGTAGLSGYSVSVATLSNN